VLPGTTTIAVVVGSSTLEDALRDDFARAFKPFRNRVNFVWFNKLSFEEMLQRSASLPPNSAILFAHLALDAHGVPQVEERALPQLRAVANAPIFGAYNSQLGHGIVGGPLLAVDALGRNAAAVALRILGGESPAVIATRPQGLDAPAFDAAELQRWHISDDRLPVNSVVLFREQSAWQRYRAQIIAAASFGLAQTMLVVALVAAHLRKRRAERLMHESEERFRVLANTAPVMIWTSGVDKKCTDFNRPWLEFTGRTIEEELGDGWAEGVHADDLDECFHTYTTAFDRREQFRMEYRLRRFDGEYRWILDAGVPRYTPDGQFVGYTGSAIDITDLKRAAAALSRLSRRLMHAQEEERTRIARELHDDVCQRIAGLAIQLTNLDERLPSEDAALRQTVSALSFATADLSSHVHAISHGLHSSKLQFLGLPAAAAGFCREFSQQHKVAVDFTVAGVPEHLPHETKIGLFRVMQEALTNALKHSGAREFEVALYGGGDSLYLEVTDYGVGFNPTGAVARNGLGLLSMRERLSLIDGELEIESCPGGGTTIHAHVRNVPARIQDGSSVVGILSAAG
jgi:PAS domain S-box-containing protein